MRIFIIKRKSTKYFILDSHDKGVKGQRGNMYEDEDYVQYSYQPSQNNKLESITDTDNAGYKTASITHGFELISPLKKGDLFLENFQWKKGKTGNWMERLLDQLRNIGNCSGRLLGISFRKIMQTGNRLLRVVSRSCRRFRIAIKHIY